MASATLERRFPETLRAAEQDTSEIPGPLKCLYELRCTYKNHQVGDSNLYIVLETKDMDVKAAGRTRVHSMRFLSDVDISPSGGILFMSTP